MIACLRLKHLRVILMDLSVHLRSMNLLSESGLRLSAHHLVNTMISIPRLDVGLLVDVFESFRISASKAYGLDPAHYYTLPGLNKDENNGIQISEYVGLRPKLYSMRLDRAGLRKHLYPRLTTNVI